MSVTKQRALSQMKTQRSTAGRTFVFLFSLRIFVPSQDFEAVFCAVQESGGEGVGRRCGGGGCLGHQEESQCCQTLVHWPL